MKDFLKGISYNSLIIQAVILLLANMVLYVSKSNDKRQNELLRKIRIFLFALIGLIVIIILLKIAL